MKKVKLFLLSIMLLIGTAAHADTTPNWSLDIPTSTDRTNWSDRFSQAFIDIDGIVPPGTADYQTMTWDDDNSKWIISNLLKTDFDLGTVNISSTSSQFRLSYSDSIYSDFTVNSAGDLVLNPTGGKVKVFNHFAFGNNYGGFVDQDSRQLFYHSISLAEIRFNAPWAGGFLSFYSGTPNYERLRIDSAGNIGIGLTPTANMGGLSIESGLLTLKERITPTADIGYGKIYPKADNELYYQDGSGAEKTVLTSESTITSSFVSDFDTAVSANSDVSTNTAKVSYPGVSALTSKIATTLTSTQLELLHSTTSKAGFTVNSLGELEIYPTAGKLGLNINPVYMLDAAALNNTTALMRLGNTDLDDRVIISATGAQTWKISDVGKIAFATPGASPGILFYTGATFDENRFDIINYGTYFSLGFSGSTALKIDSAGIGIGLTPTTNMSGLSVEAGVVTLKETTTPVADAGYVKLYSKSNNKLYVQTGDGVEHEIAFAP